MDTSEKTRVVILAGGDGQRLWTLTTDADGNPVPKQFCSFGSGETLLERTLRRARPLAPPERTYVCVVEKHRHYWEPLFASLPERLPAENIIVQPANRGTANGVLVPLLAVMRDDTDAVLALMPSDHHFGDERIFEDAVRGMLKAADTDEHATVLLGVGAEAPNHDYGWIVPGKRLADGTCTVERFVEKPESALALELWQEDALWSTLVVAARAHALLRLFYRSASNELRMFAHLLHHNPNKRSLEELFEMAVSADFSRDVLTPSPEVLRVMPAPPCGWTDLGTPERVLRLQRGFEALPKASAPLARPPVERVSASQVA